VWERAFRWPSPAGCSPLRHSSPRVPDSNEIADDPRLSAVDGAPQRPPEVPANPLLLMTTCRPERLDRTQEVGGSSPPSSMQWKPRVGGASPVWGGLRGAPGIAVDSGTSAFIRGDCLRLRRIAGDPEPPNIRRWRSTGSPSDRTGRANRARQPTEARVTALAAARRPCDAGEARRCAVRSSERSTFEWRWSSRG
jgi:hypothetical protein